MSALRDAYELIKDPERWTQGAEARDAQGRYVVAESPFAKQWCVIGLMHRSDLSGDETLAVFRAARALFPRRYGSPRSLIEINDTEGHDAIVQILEKALVDTEGSL